MENISITPDGGEVQISLRDVYYQYESTDESPPKEVLHGISLDVKKGEFVALLGHNGSGKSTIAKHMNAILLPSGGKVYVAGMDTANEELLTDIRRTVGMVFQNPDNQLVATIVEEDVAFGPENLGVPSDEMRKLVDRLREEGTARGKNIQAEVLASTFDEEPTRHIKVADMVIEKAKRLSGGHGRN